MPSSSYLSSETIDRYIKGMTDRDQTVKFITDKADDIREWGLGIDNFALSNK